MYHYPTQLMVGEIEGGGPGGGPAGKARWCIGASGPLIVRQYCFCFTFHNDALPPVAAFVLLSAVFIFLKADTPYLPLRPPYGEMKNHASRERAARPPEHLKNIHRDAHPQ